MKTAKEIAAILLKDFQDYDWWEYLDTVGWGNPYETDEDFFNAIVSDLENKMTDRYIEYAQDHLEEIQCGESLDADDLEWLARFNREVKLLNELKED